METSMNVTTQASVNEPVIKKKKKYEKVNENYIYYTSYYFDVISKINNFKIDAVAELQEDGTIVVDINGKNDFETLFDEILDIDEIDDIEVDVVVDSENNIGYEEIEIESVPDDAKFIMYIYPYDDEAVFDASIEEPVEENKITYDETGLYEDSKRLEEVKRKWKVNSKGVKRLKMKCKAGFVWNGKACVKISGADLANKRIATKKAVRTKRAQGEKLKRRVKKLTNKAKRYRKSYGLK